jgi:hypothetical protein
MIGSGISSRDSQAFSICRGGVILVQQALNTTSPKLKEAYLSEQSAVKDRIGATPLSEIELISLAGCVSCFWS